MSEERTYEFLRDGEHCRVTVPASWRVTYGQVAPGTRGSGYALRFYETTAKDSTRAVFTGVTDFRVVDDAALRVEYRAVRAFGKETWHRDDGSYTGWRAERVERGWRPGRDIVDGRAEVGPPPRGEGDDEYEVVPVAKGRW